MSEQDLPASAVRLAASSLRMLVSLGARIVEAMVVNKVMPECVIGDMTAAAVAAEASSGGQQPGAEQRRLTWLSCRCVLGMGRELTYWSRPCRLLVRLLWLPPPEAG